MAEAVGLAGSIAGLVGLANQALKGGLAIQKFFEDVRDAPAEVLDLRGVARALYSRARDMEKLLWHASETQRSTRQISPRHSSATNVL